jgi:putative transcriptional regulator
MRRAATAFLFVALLWGTAVPGAQRTASLDAGLLLYASPGVADPRFAKTVVLLVEHGTEGSLGLVVNRPTDQRVHAALDLKQGTDADVFLSWGGPVQPEAVLALLQSPRASPRARTIVAGVHITSDIDEVRAALARPDAPRRVRVFSGYAGWSPGQLAAEVRRGSWVLDRADAATVFSPEPSRMWEKVHEIRNRLQVRHAGQSAR